MTVVAALLGAAAVALLLLRRTDGAQRLSRLTPAAPRGRRALPETAACTVAALALAAVVGPPLGVVLGVALAVGGPVLLRRLEPAADRHRREQLVTELPLLLDLLAACLAGGAALGAAASAVADALPGPSAQRLRGVVGALRVGLPPGEAWLALAAGSSDDPLAPTARLLARATETGTPVSSAIGRLALDARAASRAAGAQAARRVGVLVVAPLGLCFLPAFVLMGIVPVVVGLAAPLFASF